MILFPSKCTNTTSNLELWSGDTHLNHEGESGVEIKHVGLIHIFLGGWNVPVIWVKPQKKRDK